MYSVDWYVYLSEDGENLSQHMQQGMENWVGLLKDITTNKIKGNENWLERITRYLDLYIIGGLREDVIDFRAAKRKYISELNLIWQEGVTDEIIFELERDLPNDFKMFLDCLDKIKFGDYQSIPEELNVFRERELETMNERHNMDALKDGIDEYVRLTMIDIEEEREISQTELTKRLTDYLRRKRKTKKETMQDYSQLSRQRYSERFAPYQISSREDLPESGDP